MLKIYPIIHKCVLSVSIELQKKEDQMALGGNQPIFLRMA